MITVIIHLFIDSSAQYRAYWARVALRAYTRRYDTIEEINVDSKAEYTA